ncbi:MAG: hypothetical protein PHC64_06390 [Candidatus Gastranaerophilales bacterium]|nr:hypothetical protein [Candidatus Gastranaerophilales bacterium]
MKANNNLIIEKERLLLVEGNGDRDFFRCLLSDIGIENIQVVCFGGKDSLTSKKGFIDELSVILLSKEKVDIKVVGIVLDADLSQIDSRIDKVNTFIEKINSRKIKNLFFEKIKKCGTFTKNKTKIGTFIMPDCKNQGMLETLCIKSLEQEPIFNCIENYISCVTGILGTLEKVDKRKVQIYIAAKTKDCEEKNIGHAINSEMFDLSHNVFNEIKDFLTIMSQI